MTTVITNNQITLQSLINKLLDQINEVEAGTFNFLNANAAAALALKIQFEINFHVMPELKSASKRSKNEIKYAETDAWIRIKGNKPTDGKVTDATAKQLLAGATEVKQAETDNIEAEGEYEKINNILGTVKDAHIMFRGMNKQ